MSTPSVSFNPMDPQQREFVRVILAAAENQGTGVVVPPAPPTHDQATQQANTQPAQVIRKLPRLLRLSSGQLLALASQHYGPGQHFDMKDLAQKTGLDVDTILSKNRTLAYSLKKRGLQKAWVLEEHGGWPKKFSIPASIHEEIVRILANGQQAEPATATPATT